LWDAEGNPNLVFSATAYTMGSIGASMNLQVWVQAAGWYVSDANDVYMNWVCTMGGTAAADSNTLRTSCGTELISAAANEEVL